MPSEPSARAATRPTPGSCQPVDPDRPPGEPAAERPPASGAARARPPTSVKPLSGLARVRPAPREYPPAPPPARADKQAFVPMLQSHYDTRPCALFL
ncbi:hypothetical protein ADU20_18580 [Burkholderia pseudomallei]|nr:hypothetical protein ADU20_18580 [Burkholderia pseudomallei]